MSPDAFKLIRAISLAIDTLPAYGEEISDTDDLRCDIEFIRNDLLRAGRHTFSSGEIHAGEQCIYCMENIRHPFHSPTPLPNLNPPRG